MQDASESSVTAAVVQNEVEVKNTEISAQDRYDCATFDEASPLIIFINHQFCYCLGGTCARTRLITMHNE